MQHPHLTDDPAIGVDVLAPLPVNSIVLQAAKLAWAVNLGSQVGVGQTWNGWICQALVDVGFLAALNQSQYVVQPVLVIKTDQGIFNPFAFVSRGLVSEPKIFPPVGWQGSSACATVERLVFGRVLRSSAFLLDGILRIE